MKETTLGKNEYSFYEAFTEIESHYQNFKVPDDIVLTKLTEADSRIQGLIETQTYIAATITAAFMFLYFPAFLFWSYEATAPLLKLILSYLEQRAYLKTHVGVQTGLVLFTMATLTYPFLMPFGLFLKVETLASKRSSRIIKSSWHFRLYRVLMIYLALPGLIFLLYSFAPTLQPYTPIAARIWLFLPTIPLGLAPAFLVALIFSIFSYNKNKCKEAIFISIVKKLCLLLRKLKDISSPSQLSLSERLEVINHLERTAELFRNIYSEENPKNKTELWSKARMDRVADNFLALTAWMLFPKSDSISILKGRLVNDINAVLAGTFDDLQAKEIDETFPFISPSRKRSYFKRLCSVVWLLLLVILPLLLYVAVVLISNWSIPSPLQTPLAISYSAWVAVCLFAHFDELAPEAKNNLLEIIKLVSRR